MMNFSITPPSIHHNFKPKKSTKVSTIDWSGRRLQQMEVLPLYKEITELNLSSNLFSSISARISAICSNLKELNLSKNHIRQISALSFLPNLKILNLSQNQIEKVEELQDLVGLEELNLSHNRIVSFQQNAFSMNTELASLDLSYNYLQMLPQLEPNFKLQFLSLTHNKIQSISFLENSIPECVRELHLANNGIEALQELRELSQLTALEELDLSGNPVLENLKEYHINYRILTLFLIGGGEKVSYLNRSPVTQAEVEKAQKLFHRQNSAQSSQEWISRLVQLIFEPQSDREPLYRYLQTVIPLHRAFKDMKTKINQENHSLQEMMRKAVAKKKSHSPPGNRSHYVSGRQSYGQLLPPPPPGPTLPSAFHNDEAMNYSNQFDEMSPIRASYEIKRNPKYSSHTVGSVPWHGRSLDRHHDHQEQNLSRNEYYSGSPPQPQQQNPLRYNNHPSFQNPRSNTFIEE